MTIYSPFDSSSSEGQPVSEAREKYEQMDDYYFKPVEEKNSTLPDDQKFGYKPIERFRWFWEPRLKGEGYIPNPFDLYNQVESLRQIIPSKSIESKQNDYSWSLIGPYDPVSPERGVGRINVVRQHPENDDEYWIGSAGGGIFKSVDAGNTWSRLPNTNFLTLGISDIAISPSNPDIIYIATGDDNGSRSHFAKYSIGLIKSADGGQTWEPTSIQKDFADIYLLSSVLVHPNNPEIVIVSTNDGIYRSIDGAETFERSISGDFRDMDFIQFDSEQIVATTFSPGTDGAVTFYKSNDNGATFRATQTISGTSRAELATTPANRNKIYAIVADNTDRKYHSTWLSEDKGESWRVIEEFIEGENNYLGRTDGSDDVGQGTYDLCIGVNPRDEGNVVIGGINLWESKNRALSFEHKTHWSGGFGKPHVHADMHYITYLRDGSGYLVAHDGGLHRYLYSTDEFENIAYGLPITQFYKLSVSQLNLGDITGGSQDNGTFFLDQGDWRRVGGGDGMETAINPIDSKNIFISSQFGQIRRSTNGGNNFSSVFSPTIAERDFDTSEEGPWTTPFTLDPSNPTTIYVAMTNIWRNTNNGNRADWELVGEFGGGEFNDIQVAPSNSNYVYAALGGRVLLSKDDIFKWETVNTFGQEVTDVAVSEQNPENYAVSLSGFNASNKVFLVRDGVRFNITGNLPNVPCNAVVFDPLNDKRMYIGTDIGVFTSYDKTGIWIPFGTEMLNTTVTELEVHKSSRTLFASTYGTGIWRVPMLGDMDNDQNLTIYPESRIEICPGESIEINLPYTNIVWNDGVTSSSRQISNPGIYYIARDNGYFSDYSFPLEVVLLESIKPNILGSKERFICGDESVTFRVLSDFDKYEWSNGQDTKNLTVSESGSYFLKATNPSGCISYSDTITVVKSELPETPTFSLVESMNEAYLVVEGEADKYIWYLDDQLFAETEADSIRIFTPGEYKVEAVNGDICISSSEVVFIDVTISVPYASLEKGKVFPNPAKDMVTVSGLDLAGNQAYTIFDISGRPVARGMAYLYNGNAVVNTATLGPGSYYVVVGEKLMDKYYTFVKR
ncbi:MAG: T9SS type A sorting domain-containing protein [Candidatus Kapaibacteriales bacterium]